MSERSYKAKLQSLMEFLLDGEDETEEDIDDILRALGRDPDEVVAHMRNHIGELLAKKAQVESEADDE
jgi:hypothetical protein